VLTIGLGLYLFAHATREAIHVSTASTARDYHAVAAVAWPGPEYAYQFVQDPELALFAHKALVWIGVLALWAFPLAAAAARRGAAVPPAWGFLDRGGPALRRPRIELARAALIGAVGAAAVLAGTLLLRLGVHAAVSASRRSQLEYRVAFYIWTVSLVLLAQGVVAAVTAATIRRLAIPLALFAAFLTALGGVVAVTAYPSIASCVGPLSISHSACDWSIDGPTAGFTFVQVVVDGAVVALLFAAAACGGAALWRSMRGYARGR
jgi:hypothetical protein